MAYEWIGAAAAAAASGASALAMSAKKRGSTRMMQVSKELANYNNELSLKNWRLQNEYDSPAAQMQRYKEAGLNPNLIYGQMSSGSAPEAGQVSTDPNDYTAGSDRYGQMLQGLAGAISTYQDIKAKQGQIDQMEATTNAIRTREALDQAKKQAQDIQNAFQQSANTYKLEGLQKKNAQITLQLELDNKYKAEKYVNELEIQRRKIAGMKMDESVKEKRLSEIDAHISALNQGIRESNERISSMRFMRSLELQRFGEEKKNNFQMRALNEMNLRRAGLDYALGIKQGALKYSEDKAKFGEWQSQSGSRYAQSRVKEYQNRGLPMWTKGEAGLWFQALANEVKSYIPFVNSSAR